MNDNQIAQALDAAPKFDLEVVGYGWQDLVSREQGEWVRVDAIAAALGFVEEYSVEHGRYIFVKKDE